MKKSKPTYETTIAKDATSVASEHTADMKPVDIPAYMVYSSGFPVICKDYMEAIAYAKRTSAMPLNAKTPYKVFCAFTGSFGATYVNGELTLI